jgi:hypothetical protein
MGPAILIENPTPLGLLGRHGTRDIDPIGSPEIRACVCNQDFFNRLERAIARSERALNAKLIEARAEHIDD